MAPSPFLRVVPPNGGGMDPPSPMPGGLNLGRNPDNADAPQDAQLEGLAGWIRQQWSEAKQHKNTSGISRKLTEANRTLAGEYEHDKLRAIEEFGGSDVYSRSIASKCRGATALLRDVYLGGSKPWGVDPTPEPTLPDDIRMAAQTLAMQEAAELVKAGQPIDGGMIQQRYLQLYEAAKQASRMKAKEKAKEIERMLDDILVEGQFYEALAEFMVDIPVYPFAAMKGPEVRITPQLKWVQGKATVMNVPKMFWRRVSPFDLYWTPSATKSGNAAFFEKSMITRGDLNALIGVEGYDQTVIRKILDEHGQGGLVDWVDDQETTRAQQENRENPYLNTSGSLSMMEYNGPVQGKMLVQHGIPVEDEQLEMWVQAWLVGRYVIKVQISPNMRKRAPYYLTSYEKIPGTLVGRALPEILADLGDVMNATLRAMVNNMAMASGPQIGYDAGRIVQGQDLGTMRPWKSWFFDSSESGATSTPPIIFFQPQSNASELMAVYEKVGQWMDDISAIPRYMSGSDRLGGAGRTASGLSMLMGNASKVLQTVCANVDNDMLGPMIEDMYDMAILTDQTGLLTGDESVRVRGVQAAMQRETDRQRQMELTQATNNPIDLQIIGMLGRAKMLRSVFQETGFPEDIIPDDRTMQAQMMAAQQAAQQAQGDPAADPNADPAAAQDQGQNGNQEKPKSPQGPRTNLQQQQPQAA